MPQNGRLHETFWNAGPKIDAKVVPKSMQKSLKNDAQMEAKTEPKGSRKRAWGHPVGSVKSMAGVMFSAHKGVSGRVREATFSRLGLQMHSGGVLGSILADFECFGVPFGTHFGSILG